MIKKPFSRLKTFYSDIHVFILSALSLRTWCISRHKGKFNFCKCNYFSNCSNSASGYVLENTSFVSHDFFLKHDLIDGRTNRTEPVKKQANELREERDILADASLQTYDPHYEPNPATRFRPDNVWMKHDDNKTLYYWDKNTNAETVIEDKIKDFATGIQCRDQI